MSDWRLLAKKGCGSTIVELALALADIGYDREELDYETPQGRAELEKYNPLAQVPTVILPDGEVLTETLAIVMTIDDLVPTAALLPSAGDPLRNQALRWMTFLVAAVYPTFTYGDDYAKWNVGEDLRASTNAHRERLWKHIDEIAKGPWFLGERFSALDLYIAVMSYWRPRQAWFKDNAPKLYNIAVGVAEVPRLAPIFAANFA